jgi:hypothetical protein
MVSVQIQRRSSDSSTGESSNASVTRYTVSLSLHIHQFVQHYCSGSNSAYNVTLAVAAAAAVMIAVALAAD